MLQVVRPNNHLLGLSDFDWKHITCCLFNPFAVVPSSCRGRTRGTRTLKESQITSAGAQYVESQSIDDALMSYCQKCACLQGNCVLILSPRVVQTHPGVSRLNLPCPAHIAGSYDGGLDQGLIVTFTIRKLNKSAHFLNKNLLVSTLVR